MKLEIPKELDDAVDNMNKIIYIGEQIKMEDEKLTLLEMYEKVQGMKEVTKEKQVEINATIEVLALLDKFTYTESMAVIAGVQATLFKRTLDFEKCNCPDCSGEKEEVTMVCPKCGDELEEC